MRLIPTPSSSPQDDAPDLWVARTENSVTEAEAHGDGATVVHSLSVGADNPSALRTAWSIGVDQLAWNGGVGRLIVVAAGNVPVERMAIDGEDYPATNLGEPMCQPAQAWNALTVGGYTALAGAPAAGAGVYPPPLAPSGGLSPYATTDVGGSGRPIKPEIVKEAGNTASGGGLTDVGAEHLSLWTTSNRHSLGQLSTQTYATSPAAASAAADLAGSRPRAAGAGAGGPAVSVCPLRPVDLGCDHPVHRPQGPAEDCRVRGAGPACGMRFRQQPSDLRIRRLTRPGRAAGPDAADSSA